MRRFGKRMMNESNNPIHYSGDTFYIKGKNGIYKVEINQDDSSFEDIMGEITSDWIPCANLSKTRSALDGYFDNSSENDVIQKALESESPDKKLYVIDWNVNTSRPWINYEEVDLTDSEYEEFVNDFKNGDEDPYFGVFDGNAIAFCDEKNIESVVGAIQSYMSNGSCYFNIEKMELDADDDLVESDDVSENESIGGYIDDGHSVIEGLKDYWGDFDEVDEEDAIKELQDKANYEREEDDGMRESVMRSRLRRGRMLRESRRPRGRMLREGRRFTDNTEKEQEALDHAVDIICKKNHSYR